MNYGKKILILNQVAEGFSVSGKRISAILRIETEGETSAVILSAINIAAKEEGEFVLHIYDNSKKLYSFPLGLRPSSLTKNCEFFSDVLSGFAAGISYIYENIPVLTAYSCSDGYIFDKTDFKKAVAKKCMEDIKLKTESEVIKESAATEFFPPKVYDDEAVATENYYALDEELNKKIKLIESNGYVENENAVCDSEREEKAGESEKNGNGDKTEVGDLHGGGFSEDRPYYETAKSELNGIFFKFPEETNLSKIISDSRWAKINYSSEKYYVVGVIKENGKEKYICYGVPAKYSSKPPKELKGFCSFVPLSFFDMKGDGYWMMFQSAVTGECVKPKY